MNDDVIDSATAEPSDDDFTDFPTDKPAKFYKRFRRLVRVFGGLIRWYSSVHVTGVENLPSDGGFVVVANHQTILDSPLITAVLAKLGYVTRFLAKASYWDKRMSRMVMQATGQIQVDRLEHGKRVEVSLDLGVKTLGIDVGVKRWVVAGHPEGTRSRDGLLHRGRPGLALIAIRAGVPIVPIGIVFADDISHWPRWLKWMRRPQVTLIIGKPIHPSLDSNNRLSEWVEKHQLLKYYRGVERYAASLEGTKAGEALTARLVTDYFMRQLSKLSHREYVAEYLKIKAR